MVNLLKGNSMNGIEALQALKNGNKVRKVDWPNKVAYLFLNKQNNQIMWNGGNIYNYYATKFLDDAEWEIYNFIKFKDVPELSKIRCSDDEDSKLVWTKIKMNDCVNAIAPTQGGLGIDFMGCLFMDDTLVEVLYHAQETN